MPTYRVFLADRNIDHTETHDLARVGISDKTLLKESRKKESFWRALQYFCGGL